jgi:Cupredoxin-like domain
MDGEPARRAGADAACRCRAGYDRRVSALRRRKPSHVVTFLALAWIIAGCGHTLVASAGQPVQMAVSEYRLNPQSIRASAGIVSIVVHNYGSLTHNLVVSENGQTVAGTQPIPPGESMELDLDLAPGTYLMASTIHSDQTLGAYGTLFVRQ